MIQFLLTDIDILKYSNLNAILLSQENHTGIKVITDKILAYGIIVHISINGAISFYFVSAGNITVNRLGAQTDSYTVNTDSNQFEFNINGTNMYEHGIFIVGGQLTKANITLI